MDPLHSELVELARDLRAHLEWERSCGARLVPPGGPERSAGSPPATTEPGPVPSGPQTSRSSPLDRVREDLGDCRRCALCRGRSQIVFGVGSPTAQVMIVGEGPGANEDRQGEPFVGAAGQMLDKMIENVLGLSRQAVYIANVVKCRPPENRNPTPEEVAACMPFLRAQLAAVRPRIVLAMGSVAIKALTASDRGVRAQRGRWQVLSYEGGSAALTATYHPAYLLRKPEDKRITFDDLKMVRSRMDGGA